MVIKEIKMVQELKNTINITLSGDDIITLIQEKCIRNKDFKPDIVIRLSTEGKDKG